MRMEMSLTNRMGVCVSSRARVLILCSLSLLSLSLLSLVQTFIHIPVQIAQTHQTVGQHDCRTTASHGSSSRNQTKGFVTRRYDYYKLYYHHQHVCRRIHNAATKTTKHWIDGWLQLQSK